MKGIPHEDRVLDLVRLVKTLHIMALETVSEEDLKAALLWYRQHGLYERRVPSFDDATVYYLLKAFQAFRACLPIEPGDSPFSYRKEVTDNHRDQQK